MTYLVFSFDVEDYINPNAADGILWSAELLRREGIRGCFNIVGRLAEALVSWRGRRQGSALHPPKGTFREKFPLAESRGRAPCFIRATIPPPR